MTTCEESVRHARLSAAVATVAMLVALWLSVLLPLSSYEPLYAVESGDPTCVRSHWTRSHPYSEMWSLKASLPLGRPSHTANFLVRLDVDAASALVAQTGLSQAHAEEVVGLARARASHLNAILVLRGDSLTSSMQNPLRDPSSSLTNCVQPHAYASVSVCSDDAFLFRDPNRVPAPINRRQPVAVIVVPRAQLSAQAQLLDTHGELYVHSGLAEAASVAVGATTLCTFQGGTLASARLRGGKSADERTFGASRAASGALVATVGLQPSRCGASAASTAVSLYPIASAHATTLMQAVQGTGLSDEAAFDAHACGATRVPTDDSTVAISCAAAAARCAGAPQLPLADGARRALMLAWDTGGAYTVKTYSRPSDAFSTTGEVQTAIVRLVALLLVAILVDRRATHGLSGGRILRTATRWASGDAMVELVPLGLGPDDADEDGGTGEEDNASPATDLEWLPPLCVLGLRLLQYYFSYTARQANGQGFVTLLDAVSMAASFFVWALRIATPCQTRVQTLSTMGGSVWLIDALMCVLNISTHLPLGESLTAHGFSSLARTAMGLVILTHAMPRSVFAVASAGVMAMSDKFYDSMKYASYAAAGAWLLILLCTSALVGSQLVRVVLQASADNFPNFDAAAAITLFPISVWLLSTILAQLQDPCGDSRAAW